MKGRILVALIFIPILIYVYLYGGLPLLLFSELIIGVATYEFFKMIQSDNKEVYARTGIVFSLILPLIYYFSDTNNERLRYTFLFFSVLVISLMILEVLKARIQNSAEKVAFTLLGVLYISFLFSNIILMAKLKNGTYFILISQIIVWVCDTAAYFVGINLGTKFFKERFSPKISPKKSVEGAIGGVIFSVISVFVIDYIFKVKGIDLGISKMHFIIMSIIISIVAELGDLAESLFKREFNIKDSGKILLGHGGVLDRFDSLIFVIPVVYYYLTYVALA